MVRLISSGLFKELIKQGISRGRGNALMRLMTASMDFGEANSGAILQALKESVFVCFFGAEIFASCGTQAVRKMDKVNDKIIKTFFIFLF